LGTAYDAAAPAHFESCLGLDDDNDKFACLRAGLSGATELSTCEP
jgi:hypothetical protein